MQIFILHYYRAIPLIRCLRIYTKNDNNMATVGFYLDTRREKKDGTFPGKLQVRHKGQIMSVLTDALIPPSFQGSVVILGGLTFVNFPLCIHLC